VKVPREWLRDQQGFAAIYGVALRDLLSCLHQLGPEVVSQWERIAVVDSHAAALWALSLCETEGLLAVESRPAVTEAALRLTEPTT